MRPPGLCPTINNDMSQSNQPAPQRSAKATAKKTVAKKLTAIREPYSKAKLYATIAEDTGLSRKDVAAVFDSLADLMHRHLKKRAVGQFTLPGLAKLTVTLRKASKARKGVNPFTGEEMEFAARPAKRVIKIRALKRLQDMAVSS